MNGGLLDKKAEKELEKRGNSGMLLNFVEKDLVFEKDIVIVKDIASLSNEVCIDDIVIAYKEDTNFVKLYQGVYTSNKLIGVRELVVDVKAIQNELSRPKDVEGFFGLDSAIKLVRARKYMEDCEIKDNNLVFFASVVKSI